MNAGDFIVKYDPCYTARRWLSSQNITDMSEAWDRCDRPDWLIWTMSQLGGFDQRLYVRIAATCARHVVHLNPDPRVLQAIEAAEAWLEHPGVLQQRIAAAYAALAAARAADAAAYAARAARAARAADARAADARAAYAADAAAYAARAAAYAANAADAARAAAPAANAADAALCSADATIATYRAVAASGDVALCSTIRSMVPNPFK